jgi:hypothetical protein
MHKQVFLAIAFYYFESAEFNTKSSNSWISIIIMYYLELELTSEH